MFTSLQVNLSGDLIENRQNVPACNAQNPLDT